MAYAVGDAKQIIVGAAALFVTTGGELELTDLPDFKAGEGYAETLSDPANDESANFRNVGFTTNGIELQFQPDFGEVQVDQLLDSAKLFKQGMQVNLRTAFAEATLENLLVAIAGVDSDLSDATSASSSPGVPGGTTVTQTLNLSSGKLGECPVERGLVAVGPGTGDCDTANGKERIFVLHRALSMDSVTVNVKRDTATTFEVSFRLLPDSKGSYGKMVDRTVGTKPVGP